MKIDRNSLAFKLVVPSVVIITAVFALLLFVISRFSHLVEEDNSRFIVSAASGEAVKILSAAASDLTAAALLNNPVVVEAKRRSVSEGLGLFWSRGGHDGIIALSDGSVIRSTLPPAETRSIIKASSEGSFSADFGKAHFIFASENFPLWNWKVITVNRITPSFVSRSRFTLLIPVVAFGCLLMGGGILLVLRKNLRQPVAHLVSAVVSGAEVQKTGVTEFDFIGSEVNAAFFRLRDKSAALETELAERVRAEQALRAKEEYIGLLLGSTAEGIYGMDLNGDCTFCNPSGLAMLGYPSAEQLVGVNIHALIHHSHPDGTPYPDKECKAYRAFRLGMKIYVEDEVFWRSDGTPFPVEYWSHPIVEDGTIRGAVVTFVDISQRRELEEQLLHAQKMESVGRLAGGIAHDFNNLLTPIMGYTELLQLALAEGSPERAKVDGVLKAAVKAKALVQQLLSFGRKQILDMKIIDINQVITSFADILRRTIRENITLQISLTQDIVNIMADMHQIEQIIMNLTVNAQDAISGNGAITIETAPIILDEEYSWHHDGVIPGRYVMLVVSDTGCGMDKATQSKIFEPFFSTKGVGQGTGLGLATVYGLVKQHGGHIWVYSEPGKGTTFKIYLPLVDALPAVEQTAAETQVVFNREQTCILLVEDNDMARNLVHELLTGHGFKVIAADGPRQALQKIQGQVIDLLVTDVVMPDMTGPELHKRLQTDYPDLRALFMSGYTSNVIVHHGVLDDGVNFIQKPFAINDFAKKVESILAS